MAVLEQQQAQELLSIPYEASMADVTLLGVPGRRTFTATATEVIDTYRSGS